MPFVAREVGEKTENQTLVLKEQPAVMLREHHRNGNVSLNTRPRTTKRPSVWITNNTLCMTLTPLNDPVNSSVPQLMFSI